MRFWILFFGLMAVAIPDHVYAQGTVQQVVGDLVYVEGFSADLDGKLQVAGDDGAVLQVDQGVARCDGCTRGGGEWFASKIRGSDSGGGWCACGFAAQGGAGDAGC